jgi:hypothetical protein
MDNYDVEVNGKLVLTGVPSDKLEEELLIIRGLVWTSGGKEDDIQITLNKSTT